MSPAKKLLALIVTLVALITLASAVGCRTETVTLPGKTDTLIVQLPGRRDTIVIPKLDTIISNHYDTTIVTRPETLIVVRRDTVIVHDTVTLVDTVRLDHSPAHICLQLPKADTLFFLTAADTMCNGAHMTQYYPGFNVYVDIIPNASTLSRGTRRPPLILPGFMATH